MYFKNWFSTRPAGHPDRTRCLLFTGVVPTRSSNAQVLAALAAHGPLADGYTAARVANEAAATKVAQDSDRVRQASAAFTAAFYRWTASVDRINTNGYAARVLPPELGGETIGRFLLGPDVDKVARMTTLVVHVDQTPALVGDAADYLALQVATAALEAALGDLDRSRADRKRTVAALIAASKAFDKAYGKLVKEVLYDDPDGFGVDVPRFARVTRVRGPAPTTAAKPTPPDEPADPPAAEDPPTTA